MPDDASIDAFTSRFRAMVPRPKFTQRDKVQPHRASVLRESQKGANIHICWDSVESSGLNGSSNADIRKPESKGG